MHDCFVQAAFRQRRAKVARTLNSRKISCQTQLNVFLASSKLRYDATGSTNINVPRYTYPAYVTLIGSDALCLVRFSILLDDIGISVGHVAYSRFTRESLIRAPNIREVCDYIKVKVERARCTSL